MLQIYIPSKWTLFAVILLSICCASPVCAGGKIKAEDFSYRHITLGDAEERLHSAWGAPDAEHIQTIWGIHLRTYTYGDIAVSVSAASGQVVDINLIGEEYRLRKDVRYGTTGSYLVQVYGKVQRQFLDEHTCYVYEHPQYPHRHLILNVDSEHGSLLSARITMLPLTDAEADELALSDDDSFVELDLSSGLIASKEIDVSALPEAEPVRLGGYEK